jgi:hypothetical protein
VSAPSGGTIVYVADILADLIVLREEQIAGTDTSFQEDLQFTEAVLRSLEAVLLSYEGWRDIFRLDIRYGAASNYLRY